MMKKINFKKVGIGLLGVLLVIQIFRIDKTNPSVDVNKDFVKIMNTPEDITAILRTSCYDCHSNETTYPWYTNYAPVSWWIKQHINEGRHHLNFSVWGDYPKKKLSHKLHECVEHIEEEEMPLSSYTLIHSDASLSKEQREKLISYFKAMQALEESAVEEHE